MLSKLTDTANILKAKITKDELQEKLIQATTQENWQTPTNILHEIANAAYNYEKWQKINDFIWDKLKKKSTWRKIVKALNLVDFLIKNGPPSAISSFKYDIYQFRAFSDYVVQEDGIDRGEAIRQKSKHIVQLLSNDEHLEQQREKAKKIREKMSNITGGSSYGSYNNQSYGGSYGGNSDGRYQSFNSRSYGQKQGSGSSYSNSDYSDGLGVYGDYSYGKSTLEKYKTDADKKVENKATINKPLITPDITGGSDIIQQTNKKPFQKIAKKLQKPTTKKILKPQPISPKKTQNKNSNDSGNKGQIFDIMDIVELSNPVTPKADVDHTLIQNVQNNLPNNQTQTSEPNLVNPIQINQNIQPQPGLAFNPIYNQPPTQQPLIYGQQFPQPYGQPQGFNQPYSPYGQTYNPQAYGQVLTPPSQTYGNYQQPYTQPYSQPFTQPYQNFQPLQPNLTLSTFNTSLSQQVTLQTKKPTLQMNNPVFSSNQSNSNVKWLSNDEKGLIDFSDFGNQLKNTKSPRNKKQDKGNNITIDSWAW